MKLMILFLFFMSSAWSVDYDSKFHTKHRYNKHEKIKNIPSSQIPQKMEASETSKKPLQTTPNVRKIDN